MDSALETEYLHIAIKALQNIAIESSVDGASRNLRKCNMVANEALNKLFERASQPTERG